MHGTHTPTVSCAAISRCKKSLCECAASVVQYQFPLCVLDTETGTEGSHEPIGSTRRHISLDRVIPFHKCSKYPTGMRHFFQVTSMPIQQIILILDVAVNNRDLITNEMPNAKCVNCTLKANENESGSAKR